MPDKATTWEMVHAERRALVDLFGALTPEQWAAPSLCGGWPVKLVAAHLLSGAEQTGPKFALGMISSGFRFDALMERDARRLGALSTTEIVERLRRRTTTTNHPPAPAAAMLGEAVVHGEDVRRSLGLPSGAAGDQVVACLEMYVKANYPVGGKKRIAGLRLVATDLDWSHGAGPEVTGSGRSLVLAMTGRPEAMADLSGAGCSQLQARIGT